MYNEDCALYVPCSQVQLARVVVRVLVLVDVVCVMLVVLIARVDIRAVYVQFSISVKSIVVVISQMRDATRNLAIATTMRKSFATNLGNKLDPLHSRGDARLTTLL